MKSKKLLFICLAASLLTGFRFANKELLDELIEKLESYLIDQPQQKAYLHTDRNNYALGDTLWFSAYVVGALVHNTDSISKNLYVEFTDKRLGKSVFQKTIELENGTGSGQFILPDTLAAGIYHLRAYTNWMRNFSEDLFFEKEITVLIPGELPNYDQNKLKQLSQVADCQFFPESGNLIEDIEGRVGFKAIDILGKGIQTEGFVIEDQKDTVASFVTEHAGMGYFSITPSHGKRYEAFIKQADGKVQKFDFPEIQAKGYQLLVDNLSNKTNIKAYVSHNQVVNDGFLSIIAHQRGEVVWASKAPANKPRFGFTIPRDKIIDDGVVVITLFDPSGNPQAERLIFEKKNEWLNLQLSTTQKNYKTREKVELDLHVTNTKGEGVMGDFSIVATDATQIKNNEYQSDLLSYTLLESDVQEKQNEKAYVEAIKGAIENPSYYFDKNQTQANGHLDLLMMIQGWRRFDWKTVKEAQKMNPKYLIENGFDITGTALRPNGKTSEKPTKLTMFIKDSKGNDFETNTANADGSFGFYQLKLYDSTKVLVQGVRGNGNRNLDLFINPRRPLPKVRIWRPKYDALMYQQLDLQSFLKNTKEAQDFEKNLVLNKTQLLNEVKIKGTKSKIDQDSRKIYGQADKTYTLGEQDCAGAFHPLQLVQNRFAGVYVTANGADFTAQIRGAASLSGPVEPMYLVDGVPLEGDALVSILPCDVESIDILVGASATIFGSRAFGGVISFLTKRGNKNYDWSKQVAAGTAVEQLLGYATPRVFYSPKYDSKPIVDRKDVRATIYWNPNVKTDQTGHAKVVFWTSDSPTNIAVRAEGIDHLGKVGVGKYQIK